MKTPRIYTDQPLAKDQVIELTDSAAHYVGRVLRIKPEEPLILFNGKGASWQGIIRAVSKKAVQVSLEAENNQVTESPLQVHLGQSLSRGERMDYAVQKATEMGVSDITPLFSERCEVRLNTERQEKRVRHWQQVAISACEQCGLNRIPVIHPPESLAAWIEKQDADLKFVLHHRTHKKLEGFDQPDTVSLLIGPEGGLTREEIVQAESSGFHALALGPRVLRTETAPVTAVSVMQYLWGDL